MLLGLRFQELSWDHTSPEEEEPVLWLEFDGDSDGTPVNKLLRIYSKQVLRQRLGPGSQRTPNHGSSQVPGKEHGVLPRAWEEGVWLQLARAALVSPAPALGSHTRG